MRLADVCVCVCVGAGSKADTVNNDADLDERSKMKALQALYDKGAAVRRPKSVTVIAKKGRGRAGGGKATKIVDKSAPPPSPRGSASHLPDPPVSPSRASQRPEPLALPSVRVICQSRPASRHLACLPARPGPPRVCGAVSGAGGHSGAGVRGRRR